MMSNIKVKTALLAAIAVMAMASTARADAKGEAVLKKYEGAFRSFKDQYSKLKMVIYNKSGKKTVKFTLYNRPGWTRLMKFTYPGDIRGQMILVLSRKVMYVYLPAYKRIRRIAGHVRNQGFMGSDMNFDDMAIGSWSPEFNAHYIKEDNKYWYIRLTPKKGKKTAFAKLWMKIEKNMHQAVEIRYKSKKGRLLRTQTFTNWSCEKKNKHCAPKRVRMVDHRRGNHKTDLILVESDFDHGIPSRYFTVRYLMRGS